MKQKKDLLARTLSYSIPIILISFSSYFGNIPLITNFLHDLENKTYDLFFLARHNLNLGPKAPDNIVIVGIDAPSIAKVGVPWPWPRQFHASLLDGLHQSGAKFIVYDIIFDTISPLSLQTQDIAGSKTIAMSSFDAGKEDDDIFARSIASAMNVFLACEAEPLSKTQYYAALPIIPYLRALNNDVSFHGNTSVNYDSDNFVRKSKIIFPEFASDPAVSSSLVFRLAQKYFNVQAHIDSNYEINFCLEDRIQNNPTYLNLIIL